MAMIKIVDEQGQTLDVDLKEMLGIKDLEGRTVVVQGKAKRDDAGNLTVLASQMYLRPKP